MTITNMSQFSLMFTMLATIKSIMILAVYAETLTWHWNLFCASYPTENNRDTSAKTEEFRKVPVALAESKKSIVKRQLYQIPTWNSNAQYIVSPFSSVWSYQSNLKPSQFLTPYYLIDLPNQNYQRYNPENRSYQFKFDTGNFKKQESSNGNGNIQGCFEYEDRTGRHDLKYFSNDRGGFQVTGGSLAGTTNQYGPVYTRVNQGVDTRNQTNIESTNQTNVGGNLNYPFGNASNNQQSSSINNLTQSLQQLSTHLNNILNSYYSLPYSIPQNRSYHFCFDAGNYRTEEKSDAYGNIRGYFRNVDETGLHDLEYLTTPQGGFQIVGGNLAQRETQGNRGIQVNVNSNGFEEVPIVIGQNTERVTEPPQ